MKLYFILGTIVSVLGGGWIALCRYGSYRQQIGFNKGLSLGNERCEKKINELLKKASTVLSDPNASHKLRDSWAKELRITHPE